MDALIPQSLLELLDQSEYCMLLSHHLMLQQKPFTVVTNGVRKAERRDGAEASPGGQSRVEPSADAVSLHWSSTGSYYEGCVLTPLEVAAFSADLLERRTPISLLLQRPRKESYSPVRGGVKEILGVGQTKPTQNSCGLEVVSNRKRFSSHGTYVAKHVRPTLSSQAPVQRCNETLSETLHDEH